jgi:hypothetical protein
MDLLRTAIQTAFNQGFCIELEYHLSRAFQNCYNSAFDRLWCDGIDIPDMSQQRSDRPNRVFTTAWFGPTGQDRYKVNIRLGKWALENCRKGLSLTECLPGYERLDWVTLDTENKELIVRLK